MNFFRGNIVLGRLGPSFWRNTQTLGSTSTPIVKNTVGPTPGQINTMFRQMQRLGKRGGVADMLKETRGKLNTFKNNTKTFGYNTRNLFTGRPLANAQGPLRWQYPSGRDPTRNNLVKALAFSVGTVIVSYFAFPLLFKYTPIGVLAQHPDWLISAIIGINAAFFLLWRSANPWIFRFMMENMLLKNGLGFKPTQLIGSAFSHQDFFHIFTNMFVLYQFGIPVAMTMGSAWFCHMYMTSAVASSFVSLFASSMTTRFVGSLGASGAIFAVMGVFAAVYPDASIGLFFIPLPFGAWPLFLGSIGVNAVGLFARWGGVDYAGHLGGSLAGLYFGWRVNEVRAQMRERMRRRQFPGINF